MESLMGGVENCAEIEVYFRVVETSRKEVLPCFQS